MLSLGKKFILWQLLMWQVNLTLTNFSENAMQTFPQMNFLFGNFLHAANPRQSFVFVEFRCLAPKPITELKTVGSYPDR